jgi:hypothetical protein
MRIQSGSDANFKNPSRSGSRSISEAITACSTTLCSLVVFAAIHLPGWTVFEVVAINSPDQIVGCEF